MEKVYDGCLRQTKSRGIIKHIVLFYVVKHDRLLVWLPFLAFSHILGISSSQLTKSYFSGRGGPANHQPETCLNSDWNLGFQHPEDPIGPKPAPEPSGVMDSVRASLNKARLKGPGADGPKDSGSWIPWKFLWIM